jgi:small subunit ribosomal protein S20
MAHTASAKKRLRQSAKRHTANKAVKSKLNTLRRKFNEAVDSGDMAGAQAALKVVQKAFDQAGAKKVIHKKTAGRKISRMYLKLQAAKAPKATA